MTIHVFAKIGDTIQTSVKHPTPGMLKVVLATPESCAAANELLLDENSGWRLLAPSQK